MDDKERTYTGMLIIGTFRDYDRALYLLNMETFRIPSEPFVKELMDDKGSYNRLTVRYWISDTPRTKDELVENTVRQQMGDSEVEFYSHYSDMTGYLWTDEELNVGGHDLKSELKSFLGKYLYMEITYSN